MIIMTIMDYVISFPVMAQNAEYFTLEYFCRLSFSGTDYIKK
jgi:hypothetical protein